MSRLYQPASGLQLLPPKAGPQGQGALAILIPVITPVLSNRDRQALACLDRHAPQAATRILLVRGEIQPQFDTQGYQILRLPEICLSSITHYNGLMLSPWFYALFSSFEQILIYQLDCLLLRDDVMVFCALDPAYLGAPWYTKKGQLKAQGNGGFSLRSPKKILKMFKGQNLSLRALGPVGRAHLFKKKPLISLVSSLWRAQGLASNLPLATRLALSFDRPEDEFFSYIAPLLDPSWDMPSPDVAARFAAESHVAESFALNHGPPLGAHAWHRFETPIWEQELRRQGLFLDQDSVQTELPPV